MTLPKSEQNSAQNTAGLLLEGKIAVIPTDTIYGFSALAMLDGKKSGLDLQIDRLKKSPASKPLIELIAAPKDVFKYTCQEIPAAVMDKWPGPVTVIVQNNPWYAELTGRATTAFRCPGDDWLRSVIELCGCPVYSTSVNYSGNGPLLATADIEREFGGKVPLIVTDGDKDAVLPSSLVSLEGGQLRVLRQGAVKII